jgi:hypothetical protein
MLVMVRMTPPTEIEKNDIDLLNYLQEIVNKKYVGIGKNLSTEESLRGGQNSFNFENNVTERNNLEVYRCKHCDYFSYWESELGKHLVRIHLNERAERITLAKIHHKIP